MHRGDIQVAREIGADHICASPATCASRRVTSPPNRACDIFSEPLVRARKRDCSVQLSFVVKLKVAADLRIRCRDRSRGAGARHGDVTANLGTGNIRAIRCRKLVDAIGRRKLVDEDIAGNMTVHQTQLCGEGDFDASTRPLTAKLGKSAFPSNVVELIESLPPICMDPANRSALKLRR